MRWKSFDLILVVIWPIAASFTSFAFDANYLASIILFLGFPSLYLSYRHVEMVKKVGIFSVIVSIPGTLLVESLAYSMDIWYETSIFAYRVLGFIPLESFLWAFFSIYFPVMFYEYFLHDHVSRELIYPSMKEITWVLIGFTLFVVGLVELYFINLQVPYGYVLLGLMVNSVPILIEFFDSRDVFKKISIAGIYFVFLTFIYEITALKLGIWRFSEETTNFVGWIEVAGVSFPFEEAIFWCFLFSVSVMCAYEEWDDEV